MSPMSSVSVVFVCRHASASRATQGEAAASGEARRMKWREAASACSIEAQRWGLADNEASSRKTRSARARYQGLAKRCRPFCRDGASRPSPAWLYEMKAW